MQLRSHQDVVAVERAQHLVVALFGPMRPRKDCIDDGEVRVRADTLVGHAVPLRPAECSSARTTVVPMATTRPPRVLVRRIADAVVAGMR